MLYAVCAALAEWERSILSQRTKEGMEAVRCRGSQIGRPRKLSVQDIAWARKVLAENPETSVSTLAAKLGVGITTLKRCLRQS